MTKDEARAIISAKQADIEKLLQECTEIADEADVYFRFDGPEYGMGGSYEPGEGWQASSHSC